ncbi:MAG: hypothetical protein NT175_02200 [Bacteroidetes bacterium]|nr:hypothetical protein [Bacteroidota bacterium]
MKSAFLFLMLIFLSVSVEAQHLAAFSDLLNRFYVFDAGNFKQLEQLRIQTYQVGGVCVAYTDNSGALKAYYNGKIYPLESASPSIKYTATDYLLGWSLFDFLKVFDGGQIKILSTACAGYVIQDSLIAFYDRVEQRIKVYYQGEIITIEDGLINFPIENFKSGDNIVAYVTAVDNKFKIFYQGQTIEIDAFGQGIQYDAGRDIVAYMDIPRSTFRVFYKGDYYDLEYFAPKSFKMGDDMMAYVDDQGNFKLFRNGNVTTILTYEPAFYEIQDNVLAFSDQGFLKTYCNDAIQIIERYIPQKYKLDYSTIAYIDENNNIEAIKDCQKFIVSYDRVSDIELIRDLIIYKIGTNIVKVFYYGQTLEWK